MAITEEEKEARLKKEIQIKVQACEESIAKAEKYERLKDNPDWQGFMEDLKNLSNLHEKEIKWGRSMLLQAPNDGYLKRGKEGKQEYVSSKRDWTDFIVEHEIRKEECDKWEKEPGYIMSMAAMSRQALPIYKEKLSELAHVSGQPSENGKP